MVSHPLRMRRVPGSNPGDSILSDDSALKKGEMQGRSSKFRIHGVKHDNLAEWSEA